MATANYKRPEKKNRDFVRITVVLTEDLAKRIDAEAERLTSSRSLLIRQACENILAAQENK